jgi:glycosyltransferase involved in cell wall biosynthesis
MIHLVIREPIEYQKTLCRALNHAYSGRFVAWFATRPQAKSQADEPFATRFLPDVGYARLFRELKADAQPIVILGGWSSTFAWLTLLITTILRVPVFIWVDHPHPRRRNEFVSRLREAWIRFLGRHSAGFLACGQPTVLHLNSLGVPLNRITSFPYWVALPKEWSLPADRQKGDEPLRLVTIGRQVPVKSFATAIEAVTTVNRRAGAGVVTLELIGDGPERSSLEALAQSFGANDAIIFSDWLDNHEVQNRIRASDAVVVPSTFEPYGVVVLEALANGRPVLASDGVVAAHDRDDGSGAILFHQANACAQLANQIEELTGDIAGLKRRCEAARLIGERWPPEHAAAILGRAMNLTSLAPRSSPERAKMRIEVGE